MVGELSYSSDAALHQQLGRIEGKLDSLNTTISRAHRRIDDLEKDVKRLTGSVNQEVSQIKQVQAKHAVAVGGAASLLGAACAWIIGEVVG